MCQRTQIFDKYLASSVRHRHLNVKVNTYCQRKTNTQTNKNRIPLPCQENLSQISNTKRRRSLQSIALADRHSSHLSSCFLFKKQQGPGYLAR